MVKINIIWLDKTLWEYDWLKYLFLNLDYQEIFEMVYLPNSIIIDSGDPMKHIDFFNRYEKLKYNFILVHLSNQYYLHNTNTLYNLKYCKLVIRNQYTPEYSINKKIIFIPLGYKRGFLDKTEVVTSGSIFERKYIWSFMGQIKHQVPNIKYLKNLPDNLLRLQNCQRRRFIIEHLKSIKCNYFLHETNDFDSKDCINIKHYKNVLLNTIFSLCPMGNYNIDCFRICESLESGCIPLVPAKTVFQNYDYYDKLFNCKTPFIKMTYWNNIENIIRKMIENPKELEKKRLEIIKWYSTYKHDLKIHIEEKVIIAFK